MLLPRRGLAEEGLGRSRGDVGGLQKAGESGNQPGVPPTRKLPISSPSYDVPWSSFSLGLSCPRPHLRMKPQENKGLTSTSPAPPTGPLFN